MKKSRGEFWNSNNFAVRIVVICMGIRLGPSLGLIVLGIRLHGINEDCKTTSYQALYAALPDSGSAE